MLGLNGNHSGWNERGRSMDGAEALFQELQESGDDIRPGDVVELDVLATYYDGRIMPGWVKADKWIVKSIKGDRVVINENVSHTHKIMSPVRSKYLRKISKK